MIDLERLRGERIAVMGLGKTGLSVAHALMSAGVEVCVFDDDPEKVASAESQGLIVRDLRVMPLDTLGAILWSPGIAHTNPAPHPIAVRAEAAKIPLISDIELLIECTTKHKAGPDLIAVTGTNGKSTTTALAGHILAQFRPSETGGNIGRPVLDMPELGKDGTYVLELSSYQIELTPSLSPEGVVLLNITPDHLARHGGMDGYIAAKERIFARPPIDTRKPVAVICIDTGPCREIASRLKEKGIWQVVPVSTQKRLSEGVFVESGILYEMRESEVVEIADLTKGTALKGLHNHENAACAYALIRQLYGYDPDHIVKAMMTFGGLPHRQYPVRTINGVTYINDSKATNAEATARALACYHRIYWIVGGQAKEGGLNGLDEYMPRVEKAYLIGEAAHEFAEWLARRNVAVEHCGTLDVAVKAAHLDAQAGLSRPGTDGPGAVVLSPACASWDQFASFEHRGDEFAKRVMELEEAV